MIILILQKIYAEDYIPNGIRVTNRYIFHSIESQNCKDFIWILILGTSK